MSQSIPPRPEIPDPNSDAPESGTKKEQYSLDEMLKALRDQEREKESMGEVVTRSDGSVARKVKRRRRRSDQPDKVTPEKVKKRLIFKVLVGFSICLILLLGAVFVLISFNSKSYREKAEARAGEWTGAKVDLNGLKLLPASVRMKDASFSWPENSHFRSLKLRNIEGHAGLLSFLGSRMGGLELGGAVGELAIKMPNGSGEVGTSYEASDFPFVFGRYYCDALDISFGSQEELSLKGASISLRHLGEQGWRASVDQGVFRINGWDDFPIANGLIHFRDEDVEIHSLNLEKPINDKSTFSSSLKVSGRIPLKEGLETRLDIKSANFPVEGLFGKKMARLFGGEIRRAEGGVTYTMGEKSFDELVLEFRSEMLEVKGFPFLTDLKELFPAEGDSILFDTNVEGVLRARPGGVALEDLILAQKDIFKIKGSLIVSDSGDIAGDLTILINFGLINSDPRLKNLPGFNQLKGGFVHVDFELLGTLDAPDDTFRKVIGLQATLPEEGGAPVKQGKDLWDRLTPDTSEDNQ